MLSNRKHHSKKAGLPPGTLVYTGDKTHDIEISTIEFDAEKIAERKIADIAECAGLRDSESIAWIDFNGVHDTKTLTQVGEMFGLHPLVLEDIANIGQRPKADIFTDYVFIVAKMFRANGEDGEIIHEQVSFILGKNYLLSFQEMSGDVFEPVRQRLRQGLGRVRTNGADYLLYALLDAIVDGYFVVLERFGEKIETLEERLLEDPNEQIRAELHAAKREMIFIRKAIWPMREVLASLARERTGLVAESSEIYIRDLYDHIIQVMDTVETHRDMVSGLLDTYLSSLSNKMNEVMKVLTIFASIFIPLTFIAGVYGMNFEFMPELAWKWAYFGVWGVMAGVAVALLIFFRRKKWL
ncbi:MAG TPA: magnesium/cobalt transporter CorA [candidate division Zixibacteria bacterium]|nr:magnesium/cobalt transporter CorA [candidate division Zixibacteria bacterium]